MSIQFSGLSGHAARKAGRGRSELKALDNLGGVDRRGCSRCCGRLPHGHVSAIEALSGSNDVIALASAVSSRPDLDDRLQGRGPTDSVAAEELPDFNLSRAGAGEGCAQRIGRNSADSAVPRWTLATEVQTAMGGRVNCRWFPSLDLNLLAAGQARDARREQAETTLVSLSRIEPPIRSSNGDRRQSQLSVVPLLRNIKPDRHIRRTGCFHPLEVGAGQTTPSK